MADEKTEFPEFSTDDEMVEWFDRADLSQFDLQEAHEVTISTPVRLTLADPWDISVSGSTGTTGVIVGDDSLVGSR